jgi:hypothetical protein
MGTKDQHKVGTPKKPRGQQTGRAGNPDQNREAMKNTPPLSGRRKKSNEMIADTSGKHQGADAVAPSSARPSVPAAVPIGKRIGETGGEKVFRKRQAKRKKSKG